MRSKASAEFSRLISKRKIDCKSLFPKVMQSTKGGGFNFICGRQHRKDIFLSWETVKNLKSSSIMQEEEGIFHGKRLEASQFEICLKPDWIFSNRIILLLVLIYF